jgi:DNA mismatch repair ATPase MutS
MAGEGGLFAFDEFARTTSAREAEALISAIARALARKRATLSLFATHHQGLEPGKGIAAYRVPGLDRARAGQLLASDQPLAERIKMINGLMRFGLEPDSGIPQGSEAIAVAALLGLEPAIATEAAELYRALWQAGIRSGSAEKEIM